MDLEQIKYRISEAPYLGQDLKRGLLNSLLSLSDEQLFQLEEMLDLADKKEMKIKSTQTQLSLNCLAGFSAIRRYAMGKANEKVAIVREKRVGRADDVDAQKLLLKLNDLDG